MAQKRGFLYDALKNMKRQKRKAANSLEEEHTDEEKLTTKEEDEAMKFFKRCVLPLDRKNVEEKMKQTKSFRRRLILNEHQKYKEIWDFYFVDPDLVRNFHFSRHKTIHQPICLISLIGIARFQTDV